jgi:phage terminase small subunit
MPGRPPKPTVLHLIEGTGRKSRLAKRKGEVDPEGGIPEPPEWMLPEALVEWGRLTSDGRYVKALRKVDRVALATFCQMWARFVDGEKKNEPVPVSHIAAMTNLGAKLGLNPADRVKVKVPDAPKPQNKWQQIKAGGDR